MGENHQEKKNHQEKHFFPLLPHEIPNLTLISTKTTLVPLGTNTPLQIENTRSNIIPRFPREISHSTEEGQGYFLSENWENHEKVYCSTELDKIVGPKENTEERWHFALFPIYPMVIQRLLGGF